MFISGQNSVTSFNAIENRDLSCQKAYKEFLIEIKEHLSYLLNPYVALDILEKFEKYNQGDCFDYSNLFQEFFSLHMSEETRKQLQIFCDKIKNYVLDQMRFDQYGEKVTNEILKDIDQLVSYAKANIAKKTVSHWRELTIFLKIPQIKKTESHHLKNLLDSISQDNRRAFQGSVKLICERQIQEVQEYLKKEKWEDDFDTLLEEIFENIPKINEGITAFWNGPLDILHEKTIYLTMPETGEVFNRTIIFAEKERQRHGLQLHLHDGSALHISSHFKVELHERYIYKGLWSQILNGSLREQEIFLVEMAKDFQNEERIIPDQYQFDEVKTVRQTGEAFGRMPYREIVLKDQQGNSKYYLWGYIKDIKEGFATEINVEKYNKKGDKKKLFTCSIEQFDRLYSAIKVYSKEIAGIDQTNVDQMIVIKDEPDESKKISFFLEQIKEETAQVRAELLKRENEDLLEALLDNYTNNQLKKIDLSLIEKSLQLSKRCTDLGNTLKSISQTYSTHLKTERSIDDILKQVVVEANYALLVSKENSVTIAKTMELLTASDEHLQQMQGKEIVLFMGETGTGKSTAVAYFLDVPLELFTNKIGNQVLRKKEGVDESQTPKIGQSLSTSETIYTQSFPVPNSTTRLADSPGFNDTRGGDFELCTNLSIDQAVTKAKNIKSIVVTIPANAFLDRGNQVISLINIVQERFPGAFDPVESEKTKNTPPVYLLITKENQAQPKVVDSIRKGITFTELLKEMTDFKDELIKKGREPGDADYDSCIMRQKIWQALVRMHNHNQIDVMGIGNNALKNRQRSKYIGSNKSITELCYKGAMQGKDIRKKFGDCVHLSTHTWTHRVLKEYLETIPCSIEEIAKEISNKEAKQKQLADGLVQRVGEVARCQLKRAELEQIIQALQGDPESLSLQLRQELQAQVIAASEAELKNNEEKLQEIHKNLDAKRIEKKDHSNKIQKIKNEIDYIKGIIRQLSDEKNNLGKGSTSIPLFSSRKYAQGEQVKITSFSSKEFVKQRSDAIREIGDMDLSSVPILSKWTVTIDDLKDVWERVAYIDKKYKLVPIGKSTAGSRKLLEMFRKNHFVGGFIAEYDGVGYEIDVINAKDNGSKVAYGYKLRFVGDKDKLPWIKISHTIPNHELHLAEIANLSTDITFCEERDRELRNKLSGKFTIPGLNAELVQIDKDLLLLLKKEKEAKKKIKELEEAKTLKQMGELLEQKKKELLNKQNEIISLENTTEIDGEIATIKMEIVSREKERTNLLKRKRNFALIIKTQWKSLVLLRKFSLLAMDGSLKQSKAYESTEAASAFAIVAKNLTQVCEEFNNMYDKEIGQLEHKVNVDLDLAEKKIGSSINIKENMKEGNVSDILDS